MEITNLNILMLMFQPSIVARGLEKKLVEMQNTVNSVVGELDKIDALIDDADLVAFNLPAKITDDAKEIKMLTEVGEKVVLKGKSMILVGERELLNDLSKVYKGISQFQWVDRPISDLNLSKAIEKAIEHTGPVNKIKRILIVDDDPSYAKMVKEWIKDQYKVDIVTAGMQAISFLMKLPKGEKIDLILLDYEMPIVDGPQVFQMLRSEKATARIPVVFLTGVGTREGVTRVMSLKPDGYILKSTTKEDLLKFLEEKFKPADE